MHISDSCQFSDIHISQGSVATYLRCGGLFKYEFVANLPVSLPVKEFWKSVNIWGSYGQQFGVLFFLRHSVVSALLRGNWQDYYWQDASRGPSAIAELLVVRSRRMRAWWWWLFALRRGRVWVVARLVWPVVYQHGAGVQLRLLSALPARQSQRLHARQHRSQPHSRRALAVVYVFCLYKNSALKCFVSNV